MSSPEVPAHRIALLSDRYEIEHVIGRGGMADVFRGRDLLLGRVVAIKLLREITADRVARDRFLAEARTLAGLSHPGLVTVLDAGVEDGRPYLVMELVEGRTLADACQPSGLDVRSVATVGAQVAEALAYVHSRGVVHRDVKPANVLLGNDERVLLADFGIAKLTANAAGLTVAGATVGTAAYLAPEQLGDGPIGPGADVYSLGLVLLEALTGRVAYPGAAIEAAVARLRRPPAIPDTLPPGLSALLRRMVSLRPEDRPALVEVGSVLRMAAAGPDQARTGRLPAGPGAAAPDSPVADSRATSVLPDLAAGGTASRRPAASRRPLVVAAGLVVALSLLVLGAILLTARGTPTGTSDIPPNLPPEISQDLRDLHEAVNG